MNDTILAWAAGFFDGEGCVAAYLYPDKGLVMYIGYGNTERLTMEQMRTISGGTIRIRAVQPTSKKPYWFIQLSGEKAEFFLRKIRPYSVTKLAQIDCFLELREVIRTRAIGSNRYSPEALARRTELVDRLALLKR